MSSWGWGSSSGWCIDHNTWDVSDLMCTCSFVNVCTFQELCCFLYCGSGKVSCSCGVDLLIIILTWLWSTWIPYVICPTSPLFVWKFAKGVDSNFSERAVYACSCLLQLLHWIIRQTLHYMYGPCLDVMFVLQAASFGIGKSQMRELDVLQI